MRVTLISAITRKKLRVEKDSTENQNTNTNPETFPVSFYG